MSLRAHRRAFTLPEVLASLVLIGLVLPAVMKGVSLAMSASHDARKRMEAVGLAESKLAELTASATSSTASTTAGGDFPDSPAFRWNAVTNSIETELIEIRVSVVWTARGVERSVDLSSFAYTGMGTGIGTITTTGSGGSR